MRPSGALLVGRRIAHAEQRRALIWIADSGLRRSWLTMPIICSANSARSLAARCVARPAPRQRLLRLRSSPAAPRPLAREQQLALVLVRSSATNTRDLVHGPLRRARGARALSTIGTRAAVARARARASPRRPSPASAAAAPSASGGRSGRPGEQVLQPPLADQLVRRAADPAAERRVDAQDRAVVARSASGRRRRRSNSASGFGSAAAAWPWLRRRASRRNSSMAARLAPGALRCGQWPTLSITLSVACGMMRCMYSPTARGAMMSSLHCMISVGVLQLGQVGAVVGQERDARELLGDLRIGAAEAVGQLDAELRLFRRAHDGGRHVARPARGSCSPASRAATRCRCA